MCGIVGYIGNNNSTEILIDGLKKLEYRGYDSAGVAVFENSKVKVIKAKGRIKNLDGRLTASLPTSTATPTEAARSLLSTTE